MQRLRNFATPGRIAAAFVVALGFSAWFFTGPYADVTAHGAIVDDRTGSGPDAVRHTIEGLGEEGRHAYRTFLVADMLFPLLHAVWMVGFVAMGLGRWQALPDVVLAAPLVALAADWLENLCILVLLSQHPDMSFGVAALASGALHLKFAAYLCTILVMVAIVAWMVMHPVRRGRAPRTRSRQ